MFDKNKNQEGGEMVEEREQENMETKSISE